MQQNQDCQRKNSLLEVQDKYQNFFFDMDGVFWQGENPIDAAVKTVNELQKNNKNVFFITNNSSRNRQSYVERLAKFGIQTEKKFIFCASSIIADYITAKLPDVKKAYVIGMEGICQELEEKGIKYLHASSIHNEGPTMTSEIFRNMEIEKDIGAVIVGIDYDFNYRKICYASLCVQNGAHFMATNRDNYIKLDDRYMPGGGCCVDALARAVQKQPILTGKPNPFIVNELCDLYKLKKEESIMIGDNLETDIQLGINSNIDTYLVFTGVTDQKDFERLMKEKNVIPTYCGEQL